VSRAKAAANEAEAPLSTSAEWGRLEELYVRYVPEAMRTAYLLTGDPALAEDLVHDAFARIAGRLVHLRNPDAFGGYLHRTIVNLASKHFRRKRMERTYMQGQREPPGGSEPDVATLEDLRLALLSLPYRQRAAIVLRFYSDATDGDAAELLGCAPATVRSLVARGLRALRTTMGEAT
jgi:RNA polymerase sigma factor (sigma-70 family)